MTVLAGLWPSDQQIPRLLKRYQNNLFFELNHVKSRLILEGKRPEWKEVLSELNVKGQFLVNRSARPYLKSR